MRPSKTTAAAGRMVCGFIAAATLSALVPALAATLATIGTSIAAAAPAPAEGEVKVVVTPPPTPVAPGSHAEATLVLSPPQGIKINRFPPVTLKLQAPKGISLDSAELRQGSTEPLENPEDFPFKTLDPMKIRFAVAPAASPGKARITGKLNFVFCVARSGYCERTTRDVGFDVTVAPVRTN